MYMRFRGGGIGHSKGTDKWTLWKTDTSDPLPEAEEDEYEVTDATDGVAASAADLEHAHARTRSAHWDEAAPVGDRGLEEETAFADAELGDSDEVQDFGYFQEEGEEEEEEGEEGEEEEEGLAAGEDNGQYDLAEYDEDEDDDAFDEYAGFARL